jgi:protein-S-isoprenylcysteine O-methyltransferase Ste14
MRRVWKSRPRLEATGADRRHLRRYLRGLAACYVLALGAPLTAPDLTLPGPPWPLLAAGLGLYVLGQALRGWAMTTLGDWFQGALVVRSGQRVVDAGPYRLIRHPAYAGGILRTVALGFVLDNWLSLLLLVVGKLAFVGLRIRREEKVLRSGLEPYEEYQRRTSRLVPGIW